MPGARSTVAHAGPLRWRRRLATARRVWRMLGPGGVSFLLLERAAAGRWVHPEWFVVVEQDLRGLAGEPVRNLRWGTLDDLPDMLAFGRDEALLRERLERGDRVAMRLRDGRLVAYAWYRGGEYDEQGVVFRLAPGELWGYDVWVAGEHRSRGHGPRLLRDASRALAADGVTRLLGTIDHLNPASLRAARGAGLAPVGSILMIRVLGVSLRREDWDGRRPRWSLHRGARPVGTPASASAPEEPLALTA